MIGDRIKTNISGGLDIPLPNMMPVKVHFETTCVEDIERKLSVNSFSEITLN